MKNSNSGRSSRQSQESSMGSRGARGSQRLENRADYGRSRFGSGDQDRESYGRISDEDGRFSSDDGGYYSYRNFGAGRGRTGSDNWSDYNDTRRAGSTYGGDWEREERGSDQDRERGGRRSQSQRYAPYRSSEQDYESNSRWDNDGYGESRWNRPEGDRSERGVSGARGERTERTDRSSRWGKEDFSWGGTMSGRDQEMGYNSDMTDEDNFGDFEGISGGRSARYADVDDVEGQYDEDYRDRDSYSRSRRGTSSSRSSYGSRR